MFAWRSRRSRICIVLVALAVLVDAAATAVNTTAPSAAAPSRCAPGCTKNGVCNEEIGRCDCPRGWHGDDCSTAPASVKKVCAQYSFIEPDCVDGAPLNPCLNACNGRGKCRAGWCHCSPGFWGMDCSLSMGPGGAPALLADQGYEPRAKRPWIYVYELPPRFNTWFNLRRQDRPLVFMFTQRLLSAGVRVADGEKADYWLIPMNQRGPGDSRLMQEAIEYIRTKWPWWDRHAGKRHLIIQAGDTGRAEFARGPRALTENATFLTHWGLTQDYPSSGWPASHRPLIDVVVPIYIGAMHQRTGGLQMSPLHPKHVAKTVKKDIQLLFAGRICGGREPPATDRVPNCRKINAGYSQGVRQLVHQMHWNRTGFSVRMHNPNYFEELSRTRFCLAPTGGGHGHRQILVAFSGCTPLLIGDYVLQPFEPELDWTRFSLSLPQSDIPQLPERLATVDDATHAKMTEALNCAAQHFAWSSFVGGFMHESGAYDAFETTMESLRMKLKHPGVHPAEYIKIDKEFEDFVLCRSKDVVEAPSKVAAGRRALATARKKAFLGNGPDTQVYDRLCSMSRYDEEEPRAGDPPICKVPGGAQRHGARWRNMLRLMADTGEMSTRLGMNSWPFGGWRDCGFVGWE